MKVPGDLEGLACNFFTYGTLTPLSQGDSPATCLVPGS